MEPSKNPPIESISSFLKRKQPDHGGTRAPKIARVHGSHGMPIFSSHHGSCLCRSQHSAAASNHLNFLRTATPRRIMFYSSGEWSDFPENVTSLLIEAFGAKKSAVEVSINGTPYLFDFLSMVLINLSNRAQRSVSWIDESNKCFFPVFFFDEEGFGSNDCNCRKTTELECEVPTGRTHRPGGGNRPDASRAEPDEFKEVVVENRGPPVFLRQAGAIRTLRSELVKLERGSRVFTSVLQAFLSGMGTFANPSNVAGIHRYTPKVFSGLTRRLKFEQQERSTYNERGTANLRSGWFGASRECILGILLNGFSRGTEVSEGAAYGTGIYLTPENRSFASVKQCDVDENGAQYMVLCRVIMGNMEEVPAGSRQSSPSKPEFDCGVDDLLKPKCYVVWSAHMNTHIHPEYVVSFRLSPAAREYLAELKDVRSNTNIVTAEYQQYVSTVYPAMRPTSPWIPYTLLFAAMKDRIPPLAMELLELHHGEFKNKLLSRGQFVMKMRVIVGDKLLRSTLKRLKRSPSSYPNHTAKDA